MKTVYFTITAQTVSELIHELNKLSSHNLISIFQTKSYYYAIYTRVIINEA